MLRWHTLHGQVMWRMLVLVASLYVWCTGQNLLVRGAEVDVTKTIVWGPGLKSDFFVPSRYFFIQAVDTNGDNITSSLGENSFEINLSHPSESRIRVRIQVLDRQDGSYIGRFRLYATVKDVKIMILYKGKHVANSPYMLKGMLYHEKCECPDPSLKHWLTVMKCPQSIHQIKQDLSVYKDIDLDAVAKEAISRFSNAGMHSLCHYKIIDNKIYRKTHGQHVGFKMFSDAILLSITRKVQLPDIEFFVNLGDWPLEKRKVSENPLPIFSWCGSDDTRDIVMPTYDLVESTQEMMQRVSLDVLSVMGNSGPAWQNKSNKGFWRGRDSRQERLDLVVMSRAEPELIDAALTHMFFFPKDDTKYGELVKSISFFDFFKEGNNGNLEKVNLFENGGRKRKTDTDCAVAISPKRHKQQSVMAKNVKYDTTKRQRNFQPHWVDCYPWLEYIDSEGKSKMFCSYCKQYPKLAQVGNSPSVFVSGSDNFRIEPIKSHDMSGPHKACVAQYMHDSNQHVQKISEVRVADTPLGKALSKLNETEMKKVRALFNTAYTLARYGKPFSDMEMMCALQEKNGVELGMNYKNRFRATDFVLSISQVLREVVRERLNSSKFLSILADGSTDATISEQEIVHVRYLDNGKLKTSFVSIEELKSADALGVKEGIEMGLEKVGLTLADLSDVTSRKPTIVCANFDGANVMQGLKSGTMKYLLDCAPWIFPMHCVAHKLELAALDAVKASSYLKKFEETVKGIFLFYHYSPKRRREVKAISDILDMPLAHLSGIKQVRWLVSKTRALNALKTSLTVIQSHLEHVASKGSSDESARAKGYIREISSVKFVFMLHAMCDILEITSSLSRVFQKDNLLVTEVYYEVEAHILRLEALKHEHGPMMKEFISSFESTSKTYKTMDLKGEMPNPACVTHIIDDMISYIDKRFGNFNEEPLRCFRVFDYSHFPHERAALMKYGREDLRVLLNHLEVIFKQEDHHAIHEQYLEFKAKMRAYKQSPDPPVEILGTLLVNTPPSLSQLCKLLEIMFVISPTTAECERGFSSMNLIKTSLRNSLNQKSLQMLMNISANGPELEDFNPDTAINCWLNAGAGGRHIHGHIFKSIS